MSLLSGREISSNFLIIRYHEAKTTIRDRDLNVQRAIESIENELELTCLTGVEDKLQVLFMYPLTSRKMSSQLLKCLPMLE